MITIDSKIGDVVVIGETRITIQELASSKQVRYAIDAPKSTKIYRQELYEKLLPANKI